MATKNQSSEEQAQPVRKHPVEVNQAWRSTDIVLQAVELVVAANNDCRLSALVNHARGKSRLHTDTIDAMVEAANRHATLAPQHAKVFDRLARYSKWATSEAQRAAKEAQGQLDASDPPPPTLSERLQAAVASGELEWGGGIFRPDAPSVMLPDGETLAAVLAEARHR